ncbi:MAG TPA: glycosyltransferase family 1 protein [Bacteroidales bacterium]|nr:glycosyltransferase family 1 protein [Bacteroidales bacterium]
MSYEKKIRLNDGDLFNSILHKEKGHNGKDVLNGFHSKNIKDIICFAHLRWNFVFQRPQHLLSRWANEARVFYIEEPLRGNFESNYLKTIYSSNGEKLTVITPYLKDNMTESEVNQFMEESVNHIIRWYQVKDYMLWYLTPMAVEFSFHLNPKMIVYDCMDELSCFKGAHPNMLGNENILLSRADVVFTGGHNLYEFKKNRHPNIHPFPSSIDQRHFESGAGCKDPVDQASIPHPRIGFFGVLDERFDIELLDKLAVLRPDLQFIMIGPVVKIDQSQLPRHENIHYLGQKSYKDLPAYLAHWDIAILPFAKNESTRFISPTKTPEYLAAGKPVVSTSIRDVVVPYGEMGLVEIADDAQSFSDALTFLLQRKDTSQWALKVKDYLKGISWDLTFSDMRSVIYNTLAKKEEEEEVAMVGDGQGFISAHGE